MDLRAYYRKILRLEVELEEESVVVVSLETPEGGKAGMRTEVPRSLAARLVVDGKAELASPEDSAEFRATVQAKWKAVHVTNGPATPQKRS